MMLSLVLLYMCISLVISTSQAASAGCVPAKQFRGNLQLFYYSIVNRKTIPRMIKIAYDENSQRVKIEGDDRHRIPYTLILRYKEGKQYFIRDKSCTAFPLKGAFSTFGIPAEARKVGEGRIGTSRYGVDFKRYSGVIRSKDKREMFIAVETEAGGECVFSYSLAYNEERDNKEIYYSSLSDITLSVDESDFTTPMNCHELQHDLPLPERTVGSLHKVRGF